MDPKFIKKLKADIKKQMISFQNYPNKEMN